MIVIWKKYKNDSLPLRIDTNNLNWIVIEDKKGRLNFVHKTENVMFSMSKQNRKGCYKLYKNGKFLAKSHSWEVFINQIL